MNWNIYIPIRPKACQSTRGDRGHFHVDPKVREWKNKIIPYIEAVSPDKPSTSPIEITKIRYLFKYPKSAKKSVIKYIENGGLVPYLCPGDITDNLAKGLIDCCKGRIFEDDRFIWRQNDIEKYYWKEDAIEISFRETTGIMLIDGTLV